MGVTKTAAGTKTPTPSPPVSATSLSDLEQDNNTKPSAKGKPVSRSRSGPRSASSSWQQKFPRIAAWKGRPQWLVAQAQAGVILLIAYTVNQWPKSYERNDNHNPTMFWIMVGVLLVATFSTLKHDPHASKRGIPLLSRAQTEEWKGWMQWMFIMYHYYRMRSIYTEIRVFVSCYVWMTGFGNFLYFNKTQDFSVARAVSMWIRINYFPLVLCFFLGIKLELYYVVPLHTAGFFTTMATCYTAKALRESDKVQQQWQQRFGGKRMDPTQSNIIAMVLSLVVHMLVFETPLQHILSWFSDEIEFRFHTDKYSAWLGVVSGFCWNRFKAHMQWCYGDDSAASTSARASRDDTAISSEGGSKDDDDNNTTSPNNDPESGVSRKSVAGQPNSLLQELSPSSPSSRTVANPEKIQAMWIQRGVGVALIVFWKLMWGRTTDKFQYNVWHPFIFWMPLAGWLLLRNSSRYMAETHSAFLDFVGKITLETYVLQFHVFMCQNVQHIPVIIPGSGPHGYAIVKFLNMILCGCGFVLLAWYARKVTVVTQETTTELVVDVWVAFKSKYLGGSAADKAGTESPTRIQPTLGIIDESENHSAQTKDKKDDDA